jgi:hypothetical protein
MIVPAICNEEDSPFGDATTCKSLGISYVSLSMAVNLTTASLTLSKTIMHGTFWIHAARKFLHLDP